MAMDIDRVYDFKCREPSDINEHLPCLRDYASKCQHVTEFGVRGIVSTWALIAGRPKKVVSYDLTSPGDSALETAFETAKMCGVELEFFKADTRTADIEPTNLLFIDTYHTYTQLKCELDRHAPKVSKYIIMHDTETFGVRGEAESDLGLLPAINEFLNREFRTWRKREVFHNNNGLTVLERINAG